MVEECVYGNHHTPCIALAACSLDALLLGMVVDSISILQKNLNPILSNSASLMATQEVLVMTYHYLVRIRSRVNLFCTAFPLLTQTGLHIGLLRGA